MDGKICVVHEEEERKKGRKKFPAKILVILEILGGVRMTKLSRITLTSTVQVSALLSYSIWGL